MREQPHYTNLLTKQFFELHYVKERRSYPELREMLLKQGFNIHIGTLHKYAKNHGIGRDASEAKRNLEEDPTNYDVSYIDEKFIESIDGFLLGDGYIEWDKRFVYEIGRATSSLEHQEFALYLMSLFDIFQPTTYLVNSPKSPSGTIWQSRTRYHPDFYKQLLRWYPLN